MLKRWLSVWVYRELPLENTSIKPHLSHSVWISCIYCRPDRMAAQSLHHADVSIAHFLHLVGLSASEEVGKQKSTTRLSQRDRPPTGGTKFLSRLNRDALGRHHSLFGRCWFYPSRPCPHADTGNSFMFTAGCHTHLWPWWAPVQTPWIRWASSSAGCWTAGSTAGPGGESSLYWAEGESATFSSFSFL